MKYLIALVISLIACAANATNWTYTTFNAMAQQYETGPFVDYMQFDATRAGEYSFIAQGMKGIIGCSGRYCRSPGTQQVILSSVVLVDAAGTPIADVWATPAVTLAPGTYYLVVTGEGVGTGTALNSGNYRVEIILPAKVSRCRNDCDD